MTVLLVLITFITFLAIDYFLTRKRVPVRAEVQLAKHESVLPRPMAALVGGFRVPENLRYHPGHTWALSESPTLVRVGMDDFATKLAGHIESITLPQRGQWVRQGQKMMSLHRDGVTVDMVSPIEGSVADINEAVGDLRWCARIPTVTAGWRPCIRRTRRSTFATCWEERWRAGGRRSRRAGCSGTCRRPWALWRKTAAWPWTAWPEICRIMSGLTWPRSSFSRRNTSW